jgi:molybdopterin/thiamine biosynthesis adenylyltransferase
MSPDLATRIASQAYTEALADGTRYRLIGTAEVASIADSADRPGRLVEIAALRQGILPVRYLRNQQTLSLTEQIALLESSVCVVGLGGLGGLVTDCLARMGIGRLQLIDGDVFETHNLNRQLLSSSDTIGMSKADAAARRVATINSGIEVRSSHGYLTGDNADSIMDPCDLVVDCLDNIPSRFAVASAAKRNGIPMVSAAVAGIAGHVTTIYPEDQGLEAIYGPQDQIAAAKGDELRLGCLAPGVNLIATLECAEVMKVLLHRPNSLRNRLLVADLADYAVETLSLS